MVWFNMEAIPKSDVKSDIRFGNRFDIRIKLTTWIGQQSFQESEMWEVVGGQDSKYFSISMDNCKEV